MAVTLEDGVDGPCRQRVDEERGLVACHSALGLPGVLCPLTPCVTDAAVVTQVSQNKHCIRARFPQFLGLGNHYIGVVEELVLWEPFVFESIGGLRSVDGAKADNSDPNAAGQLEELRQFLLRKKFGCASLGADVGCEGGCLLGLQEGKKDLWSKIELVVAHCGTTHLNCIVEVVHNFAGTYEG